MITISEAINIILSECGSVPSEEVALENMVGRVLSADVVADLDLPPFDRSQMDGFAVIAADTTNAPVTLTIVGESSAGHGWHHELNRGEAVRIMTGAPVPTGADAVQKVELTSETADAVTILERTKLASNIVFRGAEIVAGDKVFSRGDRITPQMIAALAAFGCHAVRVNCRPRVGILATGSEIVDVAEKPGRDQIRNSNSIMLKTLAEKCGAAAETFPIAGDEISNLKSQIRSAAKDKDILIITGGVSVGKYDLTKPALLELGAEIFFEKVSLKPGKPTVFAKLGNKLVFGLPGNPVSAAVTFELFVRPALMRLQGATQMQLRSGTAVVSSDVTADKVRDTYLPATLDTDGDGKLVATPLRWQGSSDFIGFARAEALIAIEAGHRFASGDPVTVLFL